MIFLASASPIPATAFNSAAEALLMSSGSFFAAGGAFCSGLAGACAHAGAAPAPRANTRATRSTISRVMMLLLGTSLVPTKRCHREQGRSRDDLPPALARGLGRRRSVSKVGDHRSTLH